MIETDGGGREAETLVQVDGLEGIARVVPDQEDERPRGQQPELARQAAPPGVDAGPVCSLSCAPTSAADSTVPGPHLTCRGPRSTTVDGVRVGRCAREGCSKEPRTEEAA